MTKHYAIVAAAIACCLSASAATPKMQSAISQEMTSMKAASFVAVDKEAEAAKAPAKIASAEEIYGDYAFTYYNAFSDPNYGGWQNSSIVIGPANDDSQVILNFNGQMDWVADLDIAANTITIKKQVAFVNDEGKDVYLTPMHWNETGDDIVEIDAVVGNIGDGEITFDEEALLGLPVPGSPGSFYVAILGYHMHMVADPLYVINMDEWNVNGKTASFRDGWLSEVFSEDPESVEYEVNFAVNKTNPNLLLLINPYGANTPYSQVNTCSEEGYILVDVSDSELVLVQTRLGSGFACEDLENQQFYMYNMEGYLYYINGVDPEEIMDRIFNSNLDPSTYDGKNVVEITNPVFGIQSNKNGCLAWSDIDMIPSIITLPDDWQTNAVDDINVDNSNAPVRYFNLQGVEVANPEQGQIVIKRQGTNSTKVIM